MQKDGIEYGLRDVGEVVLFVVTLHGETQYWVTNDFEYQ
jgi:hypothetical protein